MDENPAEKPESQHSEDPIYGIQINTAWVKGVPIIILEILQAAGNGDAIKVAEMPASPQYARSFACNLIQVAQNLIDEAMKREAQIEAAAKKPVIHLPPGRSMRLQ